MPKDCPWIQPNVIQKKLVSIRSIPRCGYTLHDVLICCPNEDSGSGIITSTTQSTGRRATKACENFSRGSTHIAQHIIEGKEAAEGEIPFIAALGYKSTEPDKPYNFRCGASWISKSFLLTAAHCLRDRPIVARMGTINLSSSSDSNIQDSELKKLYPHPDYKSKSKYHDIALIELVSPFKYDDNVNRICLYTDPNDLVVDHVLTTSGWGWIDTDQSQSSILLKVELNTEPLKQCAQQYASEVGTLGGRLASGVTERQYCAIGKLQSSGKRGDACIGDSGGPLHYKNETADRFFLVGITSFGLGCGWRAGIYTRVASYLDWIEDIVWPDDASLLDD
ncbi:serine protease persephone-like isoform X2 [Armigeres subalbatus]